MVQPSIFIWGPVRMVEIDRKISALREELAILEREQYVLHKTLAGEVSDKPLVLPARKPVPGTIPETLLALMEDNSVGWTPKDLVTAAGDRFGKTMLYGSVRVNLSRLEEDGKVRQRGKLWYATQNIANTRPTRFK